MIRCPRYKKRPAGFPVGRLVCRLLRVGKRNGLFVRIVGQLVTADSEGGFAVPELRFTAVDGELGIGEVAVPFSETIPAFAIEQPFHFTLHNNN